MAKFSVGEKVRVLDRNILDGPDITFSGRIGEVVEVLNGNLFEVEFEGVRGTKPLADNGTQSWPFFGKELEAVNV